MEKNSDQQSPEQLSRRSFLKGAGITSVGAMISAASGIGICNAQTEETSYLDKKVIGPQGIPLRLTINGKGVKVQVKPKTTLLELLRERLKFTGTKEGCGRGACGACTVIIDGKTVSSCMTLAIDAAGCSVETIEGLAKHGKLHPLQQSFVEHDGMQCGFCTPGMVMSCKNLLDNNSDPSFEDVRRATSGNICRCGSYPKVFESVLALGRNKE